MDNQPVGWIRLTVQGNWFTSNALKPTVHLNGYQVASRYGETIHPVPPGPWLVQVHCQWLRQYGQAEYAVDVVEGQTVDVFYAPPWHQFARGRIGATKQPRPGLVGFALLMVLTVLVVTATIAVVFP